MDRAKKSRQVMRATFTKLEKQVDELLKSSEINEEELLVKWRIWEETQERLKELNQQVYDLMLDENVTEAELEAEVDGATNYLQRFRRLEVRYEKFNRESSSEASQSINFSQKVERKFKLPIIEFKKFGGDIREWLPFWSQFQKIHDDPDIALEDKFQYLLQATIEKTRARELVESYPPTKENYAKVIDSLKTRFGRDDLLVEVYVRDMLKLVLQNTVANERIGLSTLYDKIETQLRALGSLGVTTDKCAAMLFPLVESCLPEELLRVWQRSPKLHEVNESTRDRLHNLMTFLKNEVESEQRIALAVEGFGISTVDKKNKDFKAKFNSKFPTAAGLMNTTITSKCLFCNGNHKSEDCFRAQKMSLLEKNKILMAKKSCFSCLRQGHQSKHCREAIRCVLCGGKHFVLMCRDLPNNKREQDTTESTKSVEPPKSNASKDNILANHTETPVFLQTLRVKLLNADQEIEVRAILDTGSQKSYIAENVVEKLKYNVKGRENIVHSLFGGVNSSLQQHKCYEIRVSSLDGEYVCRFDVLDQPEICSHIPKIRDGVWSQELRQCDIKLTDIGKAEPIQLLVGADVAGKLFTGRKKTLKCGVVALQTYLGWTLIGKVPGDEKRENVTMTALSLFLKDVSIEKLWKLEAIGIMDPGERKNKEEVNAEVRKHFLETIDTDPDGRYIVKLPWLEGHPPLPTNFEAAEKRLNNTITKLRRENIYDDYAKILQEWQHQDIIEEVPAEDVSKPSHYLPHRAVIKESSETTKIRPVFDASAHEKNYPSLNDCLATGENLIELIPSILLKFRYFKYGIVSDIRKAFLQIGISSNDRNYLRFLWQNDDNSIVHFRHKRVVFGVRCSPFLLGATIQYHLQKTLINYDSKQRSYSKETVQQLFDTFYVDNCITSVPNEKDMFKFQSEASQIMEEGFFDLRGWEMTDCESKEVEPLSSLLGMCWNRKRDTLLINENCIKQTIQKVTKREILSICQKIYDPIGYLSPAMLIPKILIQYMWTLKINWDDEVPEDVKTEFMRWYNEIEFLKEIHINRWIGCCPGKEGQWSIHTFVDASGDGYAAVIFMRVETENSIQVNLIQAKSRVSPLKRLSIPRLELMGATIGARLYKNVTETLNLTKIKSYFWSDSSTVITWIQRETKWATFVSNRVEEIRTLTSKDDWNHIAGKRNPADLPSRGCSPKRLFQSRWWEGPLWLKEPSSEWPSAVVEIDEDEVETETRKTVIATMVTNKIPWYCLQMSSYLKTTRTIAWIYRFIENCRYPQKERLANLTAEEIDAAERKLIKSVQEDFFNDAEVHRIASLNPIKDEEGVLRLQTPVVNRDDTKYFRLPMLLPAKHTITELLIQETHAFNCHCGVQGLMSILREKYWILGGRKSIKSVIKKCVICLKQNSKSFEISSPPLPKDRVRDAIAFEITGVDLAGPLYLKDGQKCWIVLFTCAVCRAVHLEAVTSLSTDSFLQAFRRFVARRGRPKTIYSDNGTNFVGAENALVKLDWNAIENYSSAQRISWKFNPPTAAWWGGWWERLIQLVKQLLKKVLGKACLSYEEFVTILCDCEAVINSRPLTYISNDPSELVALTPNMFLREQVEFGLPDCDVVDAKSLNRRIRYRQKLRGDLRLRFRSEYLGQLKQIRKTKVSRKIELNEVVLIGSDNKKRIDWILGRVVEFIRGKDNKVRLVRVKTANGTLLRPIQRLYSLECRDLEENSRVQQRSTPPEQIDQQVSEDATKEKEDPLQMKKCSDVSGSDSESAVRDESKRVHRSGRVF